MMADKTTWHEFNVNYRIKVKLTDKGKDLIIKESNEDNLKNKQDKDAFIEETYYIFNFYEFLSIFGNYMYRGNMICPFESFIFFENTPCSICHCQVCQCYHKSKPTKKVCNVCQGAITEDGSECSACRTRFKIKGSITMNIFAYCPVCGSTRVTNSCNHLRCAQCEETWHIRNIKDEKEIISKQEDSELFLDDESFVDDMRRYSRYFKFMYDLLKSQHNFSSTEANYATSKAMICLTDIWDTNDKWYEEEK